MCPSLTIKANKASLDAPQWCYTTSSTSDSACCAQKLEGKLLSTICEGIFQAAS